MCSASSRSLLLVKAAVRGYHIFQMVWEPQHACIFVALHELGNRHDRYAMAVYRREASGAPLSYTVFVAPTTNQKDPFWYYFPIKLMMDFTENLVAQRVFFATLKQNKPAAQFWSLLEKEELDHL